jgi:hypothetical protein
MHRQLDHLEFRVSLGLGAGLFGPVQMHAAKPDRVTGRSRPAGLGEGGNLDAGHIGRDHGGPRPHDGLLANQPQQLRPERLGHQVAA